MINKGIMLKVERVLLDYPESRDNDNKLISTLWGFESTPDCSIESFLSDFSKGYYSSPETIRRTRQLIQANNPNLRGENYGKRQNHTKTIKKELKEMKTFATGQEQFTLNEVK